MKKHEEGYRLITESSDINLSKSMPDTRAVISLTKSQALSEHLESWCLHGQKACMFFGGYWRVWIVECHETVNETLKCSVERGVGIVFIESRVTHRRSV